MTFQPGFRRPAPVATVIFNGSATNIPAGGTPFTFAAQAIGVATADRLVVVALLYQAVGLIPSVTIGGVAATQVAHAVNGIQVADIWVAAVPTGTTANVDLGGGSGVNPRLTISTYSIYGAASVTPVSTATDIVTPYSQAMTFPTNSVIVAGLVVAANGSTTWTGATEDTDAFLSPITWGAAHAGGSAAGPVTVTATEAVAGTGAFCAAAWSPGG